MLGTEGFDLQIGDVAPAHSVQHKGDWRICEIGISYSGRTYAYGKKTGWKGGVRATYCIVRYSVFS